MVLKDGVDMTDKSQKVGPQGTQVFDLSEVENLLNKELEQQVDKEDGQPALVGVSSPFTGKRIMLTQSRYQVGRTADSDICLDEPSVSSTHAKLLLQDGQWSVTNLLSSNGTYVNGDKITDSQIFPGDRIRFGGVEFAFMLLDQKAGRKGRGGMGIAAKVITLGVLVIGVFAAAAYFLL